jgi:hypothetical protein
MCSPAALPYQDMFTSITYDFKGQVAVVTGAASGMGWPRRGLLDTQGRP